MKLARLSVDGAEVVATVDGDTATVLREGTQWDLLDAAVAGTSPAASADRVPLSAARVLAPLGQPPSIRDFFAFEEHVRNSRVAAGMSVDPGWYERPLFYFTNPAAVRGPDEVITPPRGTRCLDYELEVAAVIGTEACDLDPDDPATMDVVAGFLVLNDWSARDVQTREMTQNLGPQKGKDFATSLGPWLVTRDEFGAGSTRPRGRMQARVNGQRWSDGELGDIHFSWAQILAHASQDTRLVPGDVIGSGTCGTGCILELRATGHRDTRHWLRAGDEVELEVDGLGVLRNMIGSRPAEED